jgi:hypothetical protein
MRQVISGLAAALALAAASAGPAMACGGLFDSCAPCGYVGPCGTAYVPAYAYGGCGGCVWSEYERLPDPVVQYHSKAIGSPQYYYVNQGPTYTGPGNFAPYRYYQESAVSGWRHAYHHPTHPNGYRGPVLRRSY